MKQLLEFIPIALFFIVYQLDGETFSLAGWEHQVDGIFTATAVLMVATVLQVLLTWLIAGTLERRLIWLMLAVLAFGGATLVLRNELFIQWKPTIFNWGLALAFGLSQFIGEKTLMERILGSQIHLPREIWTRLNALWIGNFTLVGGLNLYVAYGYSEETWVAYKLYSAIGFTLLLTVITAIMISPYMSDDEGEQPQPQPQDD